MIACGVSHHAAVELLPGELADPICGATEFERAGALQGLGLDQHAASHSRIEQRRFQQRRAHGLAIDAFRRLSDVL